MLEKILLKVHWLIIFYAIFRIYDGYTVHQEEMESIENTKPGIQAQINKKKKEKSNVQNFLKDIEAAKARMNKVADEVEALQRKLPIDVTDADNLTLIQGIADDLNISNISISPGSEENKGFYFKKKYNFAATGTFLQFLIFYEKIAQNEQLLNVDTISFVKSEKKQRGRFQLVEAKATIQTYRYNKDYIEDRGIENIKAQTNEASNKKGAKN